MKNNMETEEERLFRIIKQTPFEEIDRQIHELDSSYPENGLDHLFDGDVLFICAKNGWTRNEYWAEASARRRN